MSSKARAIVADPVYRVLDFGPDDLTKQIVKTAIDRREFQRLRHISQLGLASLVFPCATHTRFAHSLGAAHLARIAVDHLSESHGLQDSKEVAHAVMCAALLHDVGHGPFSHSFERAVYPKGHLKAVKHEAWGKAIFDQVYRGPLASLVNVDLVARILYPDAEEATTFGYQPYQSHLISSQLDVDRMDYLVRDAHFTGVSMGQIDVHYLIKSLVLVERGDQRLLGLTTKGVRPYEAFALARHLMNRSVYYHPKVKVLEHMLERCLSSIVLEIRKDPGSNTSPLIPQFVRRLAQAEGTLNPEDFLDDYLKLTEDDVWVMFKHLESEWPGSVAAKLVARLRERRLFSYYRIRDGHDAALRACLESDGLRNGVDFEVIAAASTAYKNDSVSVLVQHSDKTTEPITKASFAIGAYRDRPEADQLLVVVNDERQPEIEKAVSRSKCVSIPPDSGLTPE